MFKMPHPNSMIFGIYQHIFILTHLLIQNSSNFTKWHHLAKVNNSDFVFNKCSGKLVGL